MRDEAMNKLMLLRLFPVPLMKQNKVNEFDPDFDISCNDYSIVSIYYHLSHIYIFIIKYDINKIVFID